MVKDILNLLKAINLNSIGFIKAANKFPTTLKNDTKNKNKRTKPIIISII